jgi:hypothetical protein
LEGQRVSLALGDGSRIDDCHLVAAPRGHADRVWVCASGRDLFLAVEDIADAWPSRR